MNHKIFEVLSHYLDLAEKTAASLDIKAMPYFNMDSMRFIDSIPKNIGCVYFVVSEKHGVLYIGKSNDLRARWRLEVCYRAQHKALYPAVVLGDCKLHYFETNKKFTKILEHYLIQHYSPDWNVKGLKYDRGRKLLRCDIDPWLEVNVTSQYLESQSYVTHLLTEAQIAELEQMTAEHEKLIETMEKEEKNLGYLLTS